MKSFTRADRVGQLIQEKLSDILRREISDPRLEMTVITGVDLTQDLRYARVYFSTTGGEKKVKDAERAFEKAFGFIKRTLAPRLGLRYMPELAFHHDESFDYGSRIDNILKKIQMDDGSDHTSVEK